MSWKARAAADRCWPARSSRTGKVASAVGVDDDRRRQRHHSAGGAELVARDVELHRLRAGVVHRDGLRRTEVGQQVGEAERHALVGHAHDGLGARWPIAPARGRRLRCVASRSCIIVGRGGLHDGRAQVRLRPVGCACLVSAATPATFGVAIDVPDRTWELLPVPEAAETTDTPGAVTPDAARCRRCAGRPTRSWRSSRSRRWARMPALVTDRVAATGRRSGR